MEILSSQRSVTELKPRGWLYALESVVTLFLMGFFIPINYPGGHGHPYCGINGAAFAVLCAGICCHGFLWCPRHPDWAKIVTLVSLTLSLSFAVWCMLTYIVFHSRT